MATTVPNRDESVESTTTMLPRWASGGDAVVALQVGAVRLAFCALGEGMSGDYDAEDTDDVELLRLDLTVRGPRGWRIRSSDDDARATSYCTLVPASTAAALLRALLELLAPAITPSRIAYFGLDKIGQVFSYCEPAWLTGAAFSEHMVQFFGDVA
jgi:hypothetical protein